MNEIEHRKAFAQAELSRRFNNLFLSGTISEINESSGLVDVFVYNSLGSLTIKDLPLMNRKPAYVAINDPIFLISPQGELNSGLVFVISPEREIKYLQTQITQLKDQVNAMGGA